MLQTKAKAEEALSDLPALATILHLSTGEVVREEMRIAKSIAEIDLQLPRRVELL